MQAPPRGLTLEQLRALAHPAQTAETIDTADAANLSHTALAADNQPLALLDQMLRALAPADTPDIIARRLAELAKRATSIDLCVVALADPDEAMAGYVSVNVSANDGRRLSIRAFAPDEYAQILDMPPKDINAAMWGKLCRSGIQGQQPILDAREQDALNLLGDVVYGSLLVAPLMAGAQCVGLLYGYNSSARDLSAQEWLALHTICNYAAMSIANRSLLDYARTGSPVQAFFDELLADSPGEDALRSRAIALGYDVTRPSTMLILETMASANAGHEDEKRAETDEQRPMFAHLLTRIHMRIETQFPRSLFHTREHRLYCIIALEHDDDVAHLDAWLITLMREIESGGSARLYAGIGSACTDLRDYTRSFNEAREALQIGECLRGRAASARFNQLGPYRYLLPFARDRHLSDTHLNHIETLARYDWEHKRGSLLRSLETYLTLGRNIKDASELLKVHRNTLTQRLERIQSICGIDLDDHQECFALQLAIMIYHLS